MLFNSIEFILFLPLVFIFYWLINSKNIQLQNTLILVSSYVFYGWWDWRFLILIAFSTSIDFFCGLKIQKSNSPKVYLWVSIITNLGLLSYFKYANFFINSFIGSFSMMGVPFNEFSLSIILPIGISFYTFQTMSYAIDVYNKKIEATSDFISFAAFVSFFPQLVAGPIERASQLLPQFKTKRTFDLLKVYDGLKQILWGLLKKIVIADNCAEYVNIVFENSNSLSGSTLLLGLFFFSIQIYCDFSGYSDMAIGVAKLFGFDLMQNFSYPYFSRNISEFWKRWHISLSTWFKDYVYIPLGGNKVSQLKTYRNIALVFLISGLWHGANWTFVVWGAIHAVLLIGFSFINRNSKRKTDTPIEAKNMISIFTTFSIVNLSWVFFRSETLDQALNYLYRIFTTTLWVRPELPNAYIRTFGLVLLFILMEWVGKKDKYSIEKTFKNQPRFVRWTMYAVLILMIGLYMKTEETPFIYFQF